MTYDLEKLAGAQFATEQCLKLLIETLGIGSMYAPLDLVGQRCARRCG